DVVGPKTRPVLAHAPAFALKPPFAQGRLNLLARLALFRVFHGEELSVIFSAHLAFAPAFDAFGAGVPAGDAAVGREHVDGVVLDARDQQPETLFALPQFLLRQLARRDVGGDAAQRIDFPLRTAQRKLGNDARVHAVAIPRGFFEFHRATFAQHLAVVGLVRHALFARKQFAIGFADDLPLKQSEPFFELTVDVQVTAAGVFQEDDRWTVIEDRAQARLAGLGGALGAFAFGDFFFQLPIALAQPFSHLRKTALRRLIRRQHLEQKGLSRF